MPSNHLWGTYPSKQRDISSLSATNFFFASPQARATTCCSSPVSHALLLVGGCWAYPPALRKTDHTLTLFHKFYKQGIAMCQVTMSTVATGPSLQHHHIASHHQQPQAMSKGTSPPFRVTYVSLLCAQDFGFRPADRTVQLHVLTLV